MGSFVILALVGSVMGMGIVSSVMGEIEGQVRDVVNEELDKFEEDFEPEISDVSDLLGDPEEVEEAETVQGRDVERDPEAVLLAAIAADDPAGQPDDTSAEDAAFEEFLKEGGKSGSLPEQHGQEEDAELAAEKTELNEGELSERVAPSDDLARTAENDAPDDLLTSANKNSAGAGPVDFLDLGVEEATLEMVSAEKTETSLGETDMSAVVFEDVDAEGEMLVIEAEANLTAERDSESSSIVEVALEHAEDGLDVILTDEAGHEAVVHAKTDRPEDLQVMVVQGERVVALA
ncbi:hypothetical protein [Shimia isoporae]|nr:hypothetical protein [Shimia isoporae]